jgi:ribonuclease BN (tRNA processing enzyme)
MLDVSRETAVLTILGSGTCIPSASRHSAAFHVQTSEESVLLDCGPATVHGLAQHGIAWEAITHVVLSHFHTDHVGDLAGLLFALEYGTRPRRTEPLTLVGPVGSEAFVARLATAFGEHVRRPSFGLEVVELGEGSHVAIGAVGVVLTAHPTPHTDASLALRLEGGWGAIGYTGDTGPSRSVAHFLAGCRVLVAECAHDDPPETDRHLSPALIRDLAHDAVPELLVVTHVYPPLLPAEAVRAIRAGWPGWVLEGADGMRVVIGADGLDVEPPPIVVYS